MAYTVLRLPDVLKRCGLSRTPLYEAIRRGDFPAPVKLSERAVGWYESEVDVWLQSRQRQNSDRSAEMTALRKKGKLKLAQSAA